MVQAWNRITCQVPHCWECPISPFFSTEWRQPILPLVVGTSCVVEMLEGVENSLGVRLGKNRAFAVDMGRTKRGMCQQEVSRVEAEGEGRHRTRAPH